MSKQQPMTQWEQLVWERFKMIVEGNRGSFNVIGVERLSAQIEILERAPRPHTPA